MKKSYFMTNLITPTDVYGADYFQKTWGDFFKDSPIFGGIRTFTTQMEHTATTPTFFCRDTVTSP